MEETGIGSMIWDWVMAVGGPVALLVLVAERIGKLIPDDATGFWGVVRKGAKFVGAYTVSRKSKTDSVG